MLVTLGYVFLVIGAILTVCGFTIEPRAMRPGIGCLIVAVVLIVLAYVLPTTHSELDHARAVTGTHQL